MIDLAWYDYEGHNTHVLSLAGRHESTLQVEALRNAPTYALCGSSLLFSPGGPYAHTIQSVELPG